MKEMISRRYELTDEQWNKINHYFESKKVRPYKNVRNTVKGIVFLRSGAAQRDLPARYGTWNAVYKCFCKWQETGLFEKIFTDLALECDLQDVSILLTGLLALNPATIAKSLFLSTRNVILQNVSFKSSNVIAELLLVMINLPSFFLPLFTLLAFLSGYFDLFNTIQ